MARLGDCVKVAPGVRFQDLGGEAVLLELETGRYYGLDEVGTRMWSLLAEHGSLGDTERILLDEFEVESDRLRADLDRFVDLLESERLIARASTDDPSEDSSAVDAPYRR